MLLDELKKTLFPLLLGDTGNARHHAVVLLARRLSAANPGCKASGESLGIIRRGKFTFPCGFSLAFLGQKPSNFPKPKRNTRNKYRFTYQYLRQEWVQGGHRPGAEFEAAQASTFPFLVSISSLRTSLLERE